MSRRTRIITSILTVLFALTAVSALTAFAENNEEGGGGGGGQSGYSEDQGNQGGNEGGSGNEGGNEGGSGNEGGNEGGSGSDYQPQRDYGYSDDNDYDNDNDYSYNNRSSNNNNYDNDDSGESYYDMDGNRYSNSSDIYVGGDQTYTPPATIPETTAALYDTSSTKVDNQTLTSSDWKDIQAKLTEASNSSKSQSADTGDFAFIQKNTEVEDNGHWMLILGFALIILSVIGFVILIANAGDRKRTPAYRGAGATARTAPRYRNDAPPAPAAHAETEPEADLGTDTEADFAANPEADFEVEADKPEATDRRIEKPKKKSKKGTRYRKD